MDDLSRKPKEGHGFIYRYTFDNGKCYIGQTAKSIEERTYYHRHNYSGRMLVDKAIKKGRPFTTDILAEVKLEDLDVAERYCVIHFKTYHPHGYNLTLGGGYRGGCIAGYTDELRNRIKEANRIRLQNMDDATRQKVGDNMRRTQRLFVKKHATKVICLETKEVFDNLYIAEDYVGVQRGVISCLIKKYPSPRTAKGKHFVKWSEQAEQNAEELLAGLLEFEGCLDRMATRRRKRSVRVAHKKNSHRIICLDNGEIYPSCKEASRMLGIDDLAILRNVKEQQISTHGLHFMYHNDGYEYDVKALLDSLLVYEKEFKQSSAYWSRRSFSVKIRCLENGRTYDSITDASNDLGINGSLIGKVISGEFSHTHNYHFTRI